MPERGNDLLDARRRKREAADEDHEQREDYAAVDIALGKDRDRDERSDDEKQRRRPHLQFLAEVASHVARGGQRGMGDQTHDHPRCRSRHRRDNQDSLHRWSSSEMGLVPTLRTSQRPARRTTSSSYARVRLVPSGAVASTTAATRRWRTTQVMSRTACGRRRCCGTITNAPRSRSAKRSARWPATKFRTARRTTASNVESSTGCSTAGLAPGSAG